MKIKYGSRQSASVLVAIMLTLVVVVAIFFAIYVGRLVVRRARTIEERRNTAMTNAVNPELELPPQEIWLVSPPAQSTTTWVNGEARIEIPDEVVSNLFASVADYRIERADSLTGEWTATSNTLAGDLQSLREVMMGACRLESIVRSNSPMGFYRAVRLP